MHEADLSIFVRLVVIILLAGFIGWERESAGKSAGLRTHILVGVSSVLFIVIGEFMIDKFRAYGDSMRFDPVRVVEAIVTGISFLGAGVIIFNRGSNSVKGLTTAAGILTTAAIGMLVGLERFVLAIGTTVIVFVVLYFVSDLEKRLLSGKGSEANQDRS
jgi:putative Mg2+ transporter-C (MgtC) family protein